VKGGPSFSLTSRMPVLPHTGRVCWGEQPGLGMATELS